MMEENGRVSLEQNYADWKDSQFVSLYHFMK